MVGDKPKAANKVVRNCPCTRADFEWYAFSIYRSLQVAYFSMSSEFNYVKNANDECVLVSGTSPLPDDEICKDGAEYWYERTPYRQIPYSSCEGGDRPDHGRAHRCSGFGSKGFLFWFFILLLPFGFTGLVAYYYFRRSGLARGYFFFSSSDIRRVIPFCIRTIRLPGEVNRPAFGGDTGVMATLASVPWFIIGVTGIAYQWVASRVETTFRTMRPGRSGYRDLPIDEDAQILRFEDEEP